MTRSNQPQQNATGQNRRTFLGALGIGVAGLSTVGSSSAGATTGTLQSDDGIPSALPSAIEIDTENGTVTLPLFEGRGPNSEDVYYVLTESSDIDRAERLGLNWAPKLENAIGTPAVQEVNTGDSDQFDPRSSETNFVGTVDFSPDRTVAPGPNGFPLDADNTRPGSVGDDSYSPYVTTPEQNVVFNAPHVKNATGEHDKVVEIDEESMTVTLQLTEGFYEERKQFYISTDAYPASVAALEGTTHVPTLSTAPSAGDRSLENAAREPIFPIVNGPMGEDNPERQGLRSAVAGEGSPLNVTRSEQVCTDPEDPTDCSLFYSPLWDIHPIVWTEDAIEAGNRRRLTDHEEIIELVLEGDLASAADGPVNTLLGNIQAANAAVNCPIILIEEEADEA